MHQTSSSMKPHLMKPHSLLTGHLAVQVYEHMQEKSVTPTEMTFTAMARVAAGEGDGARAESLVRMCHPFACFCADCGG